MVESKIVNNNGVNGRFDNFLKFGIPVLSLMFSIGVAFSSLRDGMCDNRNHIQDNRSELVETKKMTIVNKEQIIMMQADVKYIKAGVDEIKETLKDQK